MMRSAMHLSVVVCVAALGLTVSSSCSQSQDRSQVADHLAAFLEDRVPPSELSIEYSDLHPLWGGLKLTVNGKGEVSQEAVRTRAGSPATLSRADMVRLIRLIQETRAWSQETPDRDPNPDEGKAYLKISIGEAESVIWEWYNELEENGRLLRIRELLKDLAWKREPDQNILELLRAEFRDRNPAIHHIAVMEVRSPFIEAPHRAVLARGIREDLQFQGNFADELFGLFVLNDSLTRVLAVLDMLPTARWRDFEMELTRVTGDSLFLEGRGATYGDQPLSRSYAWP